MPEFGVLVLLAGQAVQAVDCAKLNVFAEHTVGFPYRGRCTRGLRQQAGQRTYVEKKTSRHCYRCTKCRTGCTCPGCRLEGEFRAHPRRPSRQRSAVSRPWCSVAASRFPLTGAAQRGSRARGGKTSGTYTRCGTFLADTTIRAGRARRGACNSAVSVVGADCDDSSWQLLHQRSVSARVPSAS